MAIGNGVARAWWHGNEMSLVPAPNNENRLKMASLKRRRAEKAGLMAAVMCRSLAWQPFSLK